MREIQYTRAIYGQPEIEAVNRVLHSDYLSGGEQTTRFEDELADWWGTKHGLSLNSGSSANFVALQALGLPKGSEVITPAGGAFPTTISPMVYLDLKPVFVDTDPNTLCLDLDQVEQAISPDTRAIVFAHTLGFMPNMERLMEIASRHDLRVLEDTCLSGDTKVLTQDGLKEIKDIKSFDYVLTRKGYKRVLEYGLTGEREVITRFGITATSNHPFITKRGIKRFDKLKASDIIYSWNQKLSIIEESLIGDTQKHHKDKEGFTFTDIIRNILRLRYIVRFGLTILVRFLEVIMFTIKMGILSTTRSRIWDLSEAVITPDYIFASLKSLRGLRQILRLLERKQKNGTQVKKGWNFTRGLLRYLIRIELRLQKFVNSAKESIGHTIPKDQNTALGNANRKIIPVYNLLIEDCHEFFANGVLVHNCDAMGSQQGGKKAGTFGDVATCSFYPAHHITTGGEGGAILTNNGALARTAHSIRDWGRDCYCRWGSPQPACKDRWGNPPFDHRYYYTNLGMNLKMTEMQAAFGREQLKRVDGFIDKRKRNYQVLAEALGRHYNPDISPFAFPLMHPDKGGVMNELAKRGIQTRALFSGNILAHPAYQNIDCRVVGDLPESNRIMEQGFFVGVGPHLTTKDIVYIVDNLKEVFK